MSTATIHPDRPLRSVPQTDAEMGRWAAFLVAKDWLHASLRHPVQGMAEFLERNQFGWAVRLVRRAAGWLAGGLYLLRRGSSVPGASAGVVWLLTTPIGQGLLRRLATPIGRLPQQIIRGTRQVVSWCLRLLGNPGRRLAARFVSRLDSLLTRLVAATSGLRAHLGALLSPSGLPMQTIGTLAKGRALSELLKRWLPRPWNILARVIGNVLVLPAGVRRDALRMFGQWTSKPQVDVTPEDEPTPPGGTTKQATVVDLDAERIKHEMHEPQAFEEVEPSLQRYPAARTRQQTKRKR